MKPILTIQTPTPQVDVQNSKPCGLWVLRQSDGARILWNFPRFSLVWLRWLCLTQPGEQNLVKERRLTQGLGETPRLLMKCVRIQKYLWTFSNNIMKETELPDNLWQRIPRPQRIQPNSDSLPGHCDSENNLNGTAYHWTLKLGLPSGM